MNKDQFINESIGNELLANELINQSIQTIANQMI